MRLSLAAIDDEAPQVRVQLRGIGTGDHRRRPGCRSSAISRDDYGVAKAWFELHVDDKVPADQPFRAKINGQDRCAVDEAIEVEPFALRAEAKVSSRGRRRPTPAAWPAEPKRRQPALRARRRHARTIALDARSPRAAAPPAVRNDRPGTDRKSGRPGAHRSCSPWRRRRRKDPAGRAPPADLRRRRACRGPTAGRRSSGFALATRARPSGRCKTASEACDETLGLARSFDAIREELVNNRVDTEELKLRLKDGIADPLRRICGEMFPELERRLRTLQAQLADPPGRLPPPETPPASKPTQFWSK